MSTNEEKNIISNYKMLCEVGGNYISYHAGKLFYQATLQEAPQKLLDLPGNRFALTIRCIERMMRLEPRVAVSISDKEFLLSYQGEILRIDKELCTVISEHKYRDWVNNPLSFCCAKGRIIYGEYFGKRLSTDVRIYERNIQGQWNIVYAFPQNSIVHIHQIVFDKYRDCFWILTGDKDEESGIWKATSDFSTVTPFLVGKQMYRSCFLVPTKYGITYATDTPLTDNAIYEVIIDDDGDYQEIKKVYDMPGPCIYGRLINDEVFAMATSVEPDPTISKIRYRLTSKLGKGVKGRYTHIIVYKNSMYRDIAELRKDSLPMWLFQFGNALFPDVSTMDGLLMITGQSLRLIDGKTVEINYE